MTQWSAADLISLHDVEEIRITPGPTPAPGSTPGSTEQTVHPGRLIWVLEIDGRVFVRSWKGPNAVWYRQALLTHRAHIAGDGIDADVLLRESHDADDAVDAAFLAKYPPGEAAQMNVPVPRATTLELLPA